MDHQCTLLTPALRSDKQLLFLHRQYGTEYVPSEDTARAARRGIWAGEFDVPADWRKERRIEQLEKGLDRRSPAVDSSLKRSGGGGGGGGGGGFGQSQQKPERPQQQQPVQPEEQDRQRQQPQRRQAEGGDSPPRCPNILIKVKSNG